MKLNKKYQNLQLQGSSELHLLAFDIFTFWDIVNNKKIESQEYLNKNVFKSDQYFPFPATKQIFFFLEKLIFLPFLF